MKNLLPDAQYWSIVPTSILSSIMTPEEKVVFTVMSSMLGDDGYWEENIPQMAAACGMSEEDTEKALWRLQRRGGPVEYRDGKYMPFWKRHEIEAAKRFGRRR